MQASNLCVQWPGWCHCGGASRDMVTIGATPHWRRRSLRQRLGQVRGRFMSALPAPCVYVALSFNLLLSHPYESDLLARTCSNHLPAIWRAKRSASSFNIGLAVFGIAS